MRIRALAVIAIAAITWATSPIVAGAEGTPAQVANYDLPVYEQATVSQAHLVAEAAAAYAREHFGHFPASTAELRGHLPQGKRLPNVWTGKRNLPTDTLVLGPGEISYRVSYESDIPVGCEVIAMGADRPLLRVTRHLAAHELPNLLPLVALVQ